MVHELAALRYRLAENGPPWRAPGRPGIAARVARLPVAPVSRLCHPLPMRAGVAAAALVPYSMVACAFTGSGVLQRGMTVLLLVLAVCVVQLLVDAYVPVHSGMAVAGPSHPAAATCDAPLPEVSVAAGPPAALATGKAFDDAVRRALTHLCDPTRLSASPLLQLSLVTAGLRDRDLEDTRLQRAAILKGLLSDLVSGLQPSQRADGCTGAACRFYNCLYYPYVRGITRRRAPDVLRELRERRERDGGARSEQERVVEWLLQVDEDTYYKWQRRGSDAIAGALRERELAAEGTVPKEGRERLAVGMAS